MLGLLNGLGSLFENICNVFADDLTEMDYHAIYAGMQMKKANDRRRREEEEERLWQEHREWEEFMNSSSYYDEPVDDPQDW